MIATMHRELRRLLPFCGALLLAAMLAGLVDLTANRTARDPLPIALWFALFLIGLIAVGGGQLVQPTWSSEQRFLSLWPVPRRTLWLARVPLHLLLAVLTAAGVLAITATIPLLGGHDFFGQFLANPGNDRTLLAVLPAAFVLAFALSALWAQVAAAGFSLLLALVSLAAAVAYTAASAVVLLWRFGPWLRLDGAADEAALSLLVWTLALTALTVLVAGALLAARLPLLETRRRSLFTAVAVPVALLAATGLFLAVALMPGQAPAQSVDWAALTPDGRYLAVQTRAGDGTTSGAAVWRIDATTGKKELLSRNAMMYYLDSAPGRWVQMSVLTSDWLGDLATGRLRRISGAYYGTGATVSPDGRYWLGSTNRGAEIRAERLRLPLPQDTIPILWAPDASTVLLAREEPGHGGAKVLTLFRLALPGGATTALANIAIDRDAPAGMPNRLRAYRGLVLINCQSSLTRGLKVFDTVRRRVWETSGSTYSAATAGESPYLWLRDDHGPTPGLRIVDAAAPAAPPTVVRARQLQGQLPREPVVAPDGARVYFISAPRKKQRGAPHLWVSDPTGRHLQQLGEVPLRTYLIGVTAAGRLVATQGDDLVSLDPQTRQSQVLMSFPKDTPQGESE